MIHMNKKYIMLALDDEKSKAVAGVLGNKTCKKIIDLLINKEELSEKEIADSLNLPINTVEYNLKKLLDAGLIEKTKNFFWSKKGRKISMYKLSHKSIVISPKFSNITSKVKSLALIAGISGVAALLIRQIYNVPQRTNDALKFAAESSQTLASSSTSLLPIWLWFLIGALFVMIIFTLINWRKI